jgi:hypothetical protein
MKLFILFVTLVVIFYFVYLSNIKSENFEEIGCNNSNYKHEHRIEINKYSKANVIHKFDIEFPLPSGSWRDNCKLINWKHPVLWARCFDDLRHPHNSSINVHDCGNNPIHVHNGHLDCD